MSNLNDTQNENQEILIENIASEVGIEFHDGTVLSADNEKKLADAIQDSGNEFGIPQEVIDSVLGQLHSEIRKARKNVRAAA